MPEETKEKKEGLVVEEVKDDMPEASFEGDFYKPSEFSVEGIDRGIVGDIVGQIPVVATAQTYGGGLGVGLSNLIQGKGLEESSKQAIEILASLIAFNFLDIT